MAQTKEEIAARQKRYRQSERGKAAVARYWASDKGQAHIAKQNAQREEAYARVAAIKAESPCADCGGTFPPVCMDFDHIAPGKVRAVSELITNHATWDTIETEIAKCELVCANCHRLRTYPNRRSTP